MGTLLRTALTTVSQPAYDLGHESARLLLSRLSGYTGAARTVVLPTSLNVRASSAARAQGRSARSAPVGMPSPLLAAPVVPP
jgi:DNA-binding LacI/PurR family transcriptional regulator